MKHANGDISKEYTFWEDPGHGWLQVTFGELVELGIADKITPYSYQSWDGHTVYLEEDCDLATFLAAKIGPYDKAADNWREWYRENVCHDDRMTQRGAGEIFIRSLPSYVKVAA